MQGLFVASGFNGDGVKFGAVVGESMADLIIQGSAPRVDLKPLRPDRFEGPVSGGVLLDEYHSNPRD